MGRIALTLATTLVPVSHGKCYRAEANSATTVNRRSSPVMVGYIDCRSGTKSREVWLAGGWGSTTGWIAPSKAVVARWSADRWTMYSAPDAPPAIVKTRPQPKTEPDEGDVRFELSQPQKGGLATTASGRIRPRIPRSLKGASGNLKNWSQQILERHGIRGPAAARITGAWRIDLDGNGVDEVLWTARSRDEWKVPYRDAAIPGHTLASDYALLGLSYRTGGTDSIQTLAVASVDSSAPEYRILCPLDLDRDGRLEIYAQASDFEDHRLLAFVFDGKSARGILATPRPAVGGEAPGR